MEAHRKGMRKVKNEGSANAAAATSRRRCDMMGNTGLVLQGHLLNSELGRQSEVLIH